MYWSQDLRSLQGQSLETVGINLRRCDFTHGQLYVALSLVTAFNGLRLLFAENNKPEITDNVVYPEVLLQTVIA